MDHTIEKYNVNGCLYIWNYKERNPNKKNWNFTADNDACSSLLGLINLMEQSDFSSNKFIATIMPTNLQIDIPNDRNPEWSTISSVEIKYLKEGTDQWEIIEKADSIKIIIGKNKMPEFKKAILRMKEGEGDFGICDSEENNVLYCWWNAKK